MPLGRDGKHVKVRAAGENSSPLGAARSRQDKGNSLGWTFRPRMNNWKGQDRVDFIMDSITVSDRSGREGIDP